MTISICCLEPLRTPLEFALTVTTLKAVRFRDAANLAGIVKITKLKKKGKEKSNCGQKARVLIV